MKEEILEELNIKENHERECKLAAGGLPESIWETYSSFANTNGGTILLGIREYRDSFTVEGLTDKQIVKYQKDFWSTLNDRNKVSKKKCSAQGNFQSVSGIYPHYAAVGITFPVLL